MLAAAAILGAVLALGSLAIAPAWGIPLLMIVRPLVDTQYSQVLVGGLKLTEIVSVVAPVIVLARALMATDRHASVAAMPLRWIWLLWVADIVLFSSVVAAVSGPLEGLDVFFRHINGFTGFYMVQAYLGKDDRGTRMFVLALVVAGLFPMATGLIEAVTGHHWTVTYGEDMVVRGIGLYHDAITIRYYALQTILGLALTVSLYLGRRWLLRGVAVAYGLVAALVVQQAYSKSGTATLALWTVLWPTLQRKYRQVAIVLGAGLAVAVWYGKEVMATLGFIFRQEIGLVQGTTSFEHSLTGRVPLWEQMLGQWQSFDAAAKLFGSGHKATGAHNDYLQVLFHGGLLALIIYLSLLVLVFVRVIRDLAERPEPLRVAALLVLLMWMVDTLGLVISAFPGYQWFVWGVVGLSMRRAADARAIVRTAAAPTVRAAISATPAFLGNLMR
jgi:hypothetical protein